MSSPQRQQFQHLERLFHNALDLDEGPARDRYLAEVTAGDPETGGQLRSLLDHHRHVRATAAEPLERLPRFGAWQTMRILGRGGMGSVYLAGRADGAFQMQAAVKVVPLALASAEIEERFLRERQFLAMLNHTGISRLIDGGVSEIGLPYLVMEFVDGEPIDSYADRHGLSVKDRAGLMRQVLQALSYVHAQRVLHRDLKPSNILVDKSGQVKLVDFGIARLIAGDMPNVGLTTFSLALTPDYASPEQMAGGRLDEASDIYSAGVVFHKLVTGQLPAQTSEPIQDPRLRAIVAHATAKIPSARYASAAEMDADIARYIADEPVNAAVRNPRAKLVGIFAIALIAILSAWLVTRPVSIPASVAVLPFANAGGDPADRYFSDGVTDEIRAMLEKTRPILVIARASSLPFRDSKAGGKEIGRQLHAAYLVEGNVSRTAGRVRIAARLKRTADGSSIWEKTYERTESGLFSLQADVARDVAASLKATMPSAPAKHVVTNQEAINLLMRARFEAEQFTASSFEDAEGDLRRAIEIDPQYASAYAVLGATIINRGSSIHDLEGHHKVVEAGTAYYRKALELDPSLVVPRVNLAGFMLQDSWDWKGAEAEYRLALANGPNAVANTAYGLMLAEQSRFAEADERFKSAEEQNAYAISQMINMANARIFERRYADALGIDELMTARSMNPVGARQNIDWIHVLQGRADLALADYDQHQDSTPLGKMQRAQALAFSGRREEALALIQPMEGDYRKFMPATSFAAVYARFDPDRAIAWLTKGADDHDFALLSIGVSQAFDPVRQTPGFQALLRRIGLVR